MKIWKMSAAMRWLISLQANQIYLLTLAMNSRQPEPCPWMTPYNAPQPTDFRNTRKTAPA